jgi:peptidoglycan hydrolase CwlO-like protein
MDKKSKKKIDVLRKRIEKLQRLLHDAKEQMDDPGEVDKLEAALAESKAEIARLKSG